MSTMANGLAQNTNPHTPEATAPLATQITPATAAVPVVAPAPPATPEAIEPAQPMRKPTHLSRAQILDATEVCLKTEGYDGTTIRRIAKELSCAVGSIYRYFKDKRELLAAVTQRRFEPVQTAFEAGMATEQVLRMYARIAGEQPEQYRLMFWLASVGQNEAGRHLPQAIERIIELWAARVEDRRQAELQWAQLHGNLMLGLVSRETPSGTSSIIETVNTPQSAEDLTLL